MLYQCTKTVKTNRALALKDIKLYKVVLAKKKHLCCHLFPNNEDRMKLERSLTPKDNLTPNLCSTDTYHS